MSIRTVWKFPVPIVDVPSLAMPRGAKILSAGVQDEEVFVWALCNPDAPLVTRRFAFAGTGHARQDLDDAAFIDTVMLMDGALVFHVFDLGETP